MVAYGGANAELPQDDRSLQQISLSRRTPSFSGALHGLRLHRDDKVNDAIVSLATRLAGRSDVQRAVIEELQDQIEGFSSVVDDSRVSLLDDREQAQPSADSDSESASDDDAEMEDSFVLLSAPASPSAVDLSASVVEVKADHSLLEPGSVAAQPLPVSHFVPQPPVSEQPVNNGVCVNQVEGVRVAEQCADEPGAEPQPSGLSDIEQPGQSIRVDYPSSEYIRAAGVDVDAQRLRRAQAHAQAQAQADALNAHEVGLVERLVQWLKQRLAEVLDDQPGARSPSERPTGEAAALPLFSDEQIEGQPRVAELGSPERAAKLHQLPAYASGPARATPANEGPLLRLQENEANKPRERPVVGTKFLTTAALGLAAVLVCLTALRRSNARVHAAVVNQL